MFIHRLLTDAILRGLKRSPAVLLTGARQTGKSTLAKQITKQKGYTYITFDDLGYLAAAKSDPMGFIDGIDKPVILDEVQRVPHIFLPIKKDIDENRKPGRYILTGSANPLLIPRLGDSLAGRMEYYKLYPFSMGELLGTPEQFIDKAFKGDPRAFEVGFMSREELVERMIVGGFPLVQGQDDEGRRKWFQGYITAIIERDIKDYAHIDGLTQFPALLTLLASRVGGLSNVAEISRASRIKLKTLHRYMQLLKAFYLILELRPWHADIGTTLVKSPKLYMVDTGLLAHCRKVNAEKILTNNELMGTFFENFVIIELLKQAGWSKRYVELYHYRTTYGVEVDVVLQDQTGNVVGIEVKSGSTVESGMFSGLKHLKKKMGDRFVQGIVIYTGSEKIPFGKDLVALPVASLWL